MDKSDNKKCELKLSVRKIVEHVMRRGDIDSRYVDSDIMLEGARAHRKIQRSMGADYKAEVSLSISANFGDIPATVSGRADGVFTASDGILTVHEIKTTTNAIDHFHECKGETHFAQAKYYAHMLTVAMDAPPASVRIRITYYHLETGETANIEQIFLCKDLINAFNEINEKYAVWLEFERDWIAARNDSIKITGFPYPNYRKGQREMAVQVYRTIEAKKKLYLQAPTGIVKTLSALFPSIKALGENKADKIFYLTAKTVTRAVVEDSVELMLRKGLKLKTVTLRAKDKICFCEERLCNPDDCCYAKGHYDRVNDALFNMLTNCDLITPAAVEEYADKGCVCPYELSLDAALWADVIICDYNHIFDPVVYLRRFFGDGAQGDYVFLIDEVHNLPDRVRDMYTAHICKSDFLKIKRELKGKEPHVKKLRKVAGLTADYLKSLNNENVTLPVANAENDAAILAVTLQFTKAAEEFFENEKENRHPLFKELTELYFKVVAYQSIFEIYDDHYMTLTESIDSDVINTLFCIDPSEIIRQRLELAKATVMFSATLTPLEYYRDLLGGSQEDGLLDLDSPFESNRLLLIGHYGISIKYADRESSLEPVADALYLLSSHKKGNYFAYFPSYEYLKKIYQIFTSKYPDVNTLLQQNNMSEKERTEFLDKFSADNCQTLIGFSVLGGIFSEGIDLAGERLIGSFIVGVGLPKISFRQELIKNYFNAKNNSGYDYAYTFPGMNKVMQAAGRVIRSESDYGAVVIIDTRFNTGKYKALYPSHWSHIKMVKNNIDLEKKLDEFDLFR